MGGVSLFYFSDKSKAGAIRRRKAAGPPKFLTKADSRATEEKLIISQFFYQVE
jgi:hypothetical protein